jgi:hypothetical protein
MRMAVAITLLLAACQAGAGAGETCAANDGCASPLVCRFGRCRVDCHSNRDCPVGATCLTSQGAGACSVGTDLGCETGVGRTCPSPLACVADRCAATCTTRADCPIDGECRTSSAGVSFCFDIGSESDAGVADAAAEDALSQMPDVGIDAGPCFGRLDCDTDPSDCETEVLSDPMHCGTCTRRCAVRANAMPACTNGNCDVACDPGFLDCDDDPLTGCEIDGNTDASHCGTCMRACSGTDPICARGDCYPLPFPSDGTDGVFHATADQVLHAGRYDFVSFTIDTGVTVTTDGDGVLDIRVRGEVRIQGALDASGARGGTLSAGTCTPGGANSGGGATADVLGVGHAWANDSSCQAAGVGGSGGTGASTGAGASGCGAGGMFGGGAGGGRRFGGGGGGGYAGGGGGGNGGAGGTRAGAAGGAVSGEGTGGIAGSGLGVGGGGGDATIGSPHAGHDAPALASCGPGGGGGGSIGMAAAMDQAVATTFRAGSGGGGGGGNDCGGGGGGGGGGGAIRIASGTQITIDVTGEVRADGGAGAGVPPGSANRGGGGGGGSGGVIFLSAPALDLTGIVSARGGAGATAACAQSYGGGGGLGRIRLSALADHCTIAGTWSHTLRAGCAPTTGGGAPGIVYIDAYPF